MDKLHNNKPAAPERGADSAHADAGRRVLETEISGLRALSQSLGAHFDRAVETLSAAKGRIVVTGMGKSGHIGHKIAATLASTGSPAQFVHPGEASHGDLGMITREDAVIALSKSGETAELADLLAYTRRFSIPLIAITGVAESALGRAADILLLLPDAEEACPNGLAPTTSTTMTLALGDALAVALMEKAGFTANKFKEFHPGGKLGAQLRAVRDLMHAGGAMPLAAPDTPMSEALVVMTEKRFGCVGVQDTDGRLIGIITDGDLRRHMSPNLLERQAGEIMTASPKTVAPGALAVEATALMQGTITSLFVVENERPVGILHIHDILRAGVV